ncbi:MAG: ABC transporter permease [Leptospiraceae bacterium]|nr:ABC transporter permease [Leptospiraceae bacterium]
MKAYIIRRLLYFIPVWVGVYSLTFALFHLRDPMTLAASQMPQADERTLQDWVRRYEYHLPLLLNLPGSESSVRADGQQHPEFAEHGILYSRYFRSLVNLFSMNLGVDRTGKSIATAFAERIGPTVSVMFPALMLTILISIVLGLVAAYFRNTLVDASIIFLAVAMMSIALPVYILAAYFLFGQVLKLTPIYGHILLPIMIAVLAATGGWIRFYHSVLLEEMGREYIRSARARGVSEVMIMARHVLRNSLIPILTSVVMSLPYMITGSLLLEQFFGIAGMGDMLYSAIVRQDFPVIQAMVYLGSFLYLFASLLTDILYAVVDPRIAFDR